MLSQSLEKSVASPYIFKGSQRLRCISFYLNAIERMNTVEVRITALVVIYNRRCEESPSCEALRGDPCARAVIVDNSTEDNDNARYCARRGFGYVTMGGNMGLAKAYNRGIAWIKENTDATHVLLLDDDTTLPDGFLTATASVIEQRPQASVFAPLVQDEQGLLSPCRIDGLRVTREAEPAVLTAPTFTAINSGLTIDLSVFDDYAYDEGYFLDYIDHAFFRDMKARGVNFTVTDQTLCQRFAGNERGNKRAAIRRLRIFKKDFRRFCGKSLRGRLFATAVIIRRRIKIALS